MTGEHRVRKHRSGEPISRREYRIGRRLRSRGEQALFSCLLDMRDASLGLGLQLGRLHAVGGEGALFEIRDPAEPGTRLLGKVGLVPWHKAIKLTSKVVRRQRNLIEGEAALLESAGSPYLPSSRGLRQFENPLLESARGGEFAELEPCLVMERMPGQDLDVWLCRVHRGYLQWIPLRRALDRLAVGLLQALTDLERRGFLYADLRPGNLRVLGRPVRRVRLLDAGGCVRAADEDRLFPHVPSYLPPDVFWARDRGETIRPTPATQAVMAGRTLFEVATGQNPQAGAPLDETALLRAPISAPVGEVIVNLARGGFPDCASALDALASRATRRVPTT